MEVVNPEFKKGIPQHQNLSKYFPQPSSSIVAGNLYFYSNFNGMCTSESEEMYASLWRSEIKVNETFQTGSKSSFYSNEHIFLSNEAKKYENVCQKKTSSKYQ